MDPFRSFEDVDAWVKANGINRLRLMLAGEQMRSGSQYWGCAWLSRHEAQRRQELEDARMELARTLESALLV